MEVVVTTGAIRLQSCNQLVNTNKPTPNTFTGQMPFLSPTNSVRALTLLYNKFFFKLNRYTTEHQLWKMNHKQ